jgi:hypothetical protein
MTRCRFCGRDTAPQTHFRHEYFCSRNPCAPPRRRPSSAASAGAARGAPRARRGSAPAAPASAVAGDAVEGARDADGADGADLGGALGGGDDDDADHAADYDVGVTAEAPRLALDSAAASGEGDVADADDAAVAQAAPGADGAGDVVEDVALDYAAAPADDAILEEVSTRARADRRFMRAMQLQVRRRYRLAFAVALFVRTRNSISEGQTLLDAIAASAPGAAFLRAETGSIATAEALHKNVTRLVQLWVHTLRGATADGRVQTHRLGIPRSLHALGVAGVARSFSVPVPLALMSWLRGRVFDAQRVRTFLNALVAPSMAPCPPPPHFDIDEEAAPILALQSPAIFSACFYAAQHLREYRVPDALLTPTQRTWRRVAFPFPVVLSIDGVNLTRSRVNTNAFNIVSMANVLLNYDELKRPHHVRTLAMLATLSGTAQREKRMAFAAQFFSAVGAPLVELYKRPMVLTDVFAETVLVMSPVVVVLSGDHLALSAALGSSAARCSTCVVPKALLRHVLQVAPSPRTTDVVDAARERVQTLPPRFHRARRGAEERAAADEVKRLGVWPETPPLAPLERAYGQRVLGPCGFWSRVAFSMLHTLLLGPVKDTCVLIEYMVKEEGNEKAMVARVASLLYFTDGVRIIHAFPNYPMRGEIPGVQFRDLLLALYTALGDKPDMLPVEDHERVVRVCEHLLELIALLRCDTLGEAERRAVTRHSSRFVQLFPAAFHEALSATQERPGEPLLERFKLHALAHELERSIVNFGSPALINDAVFEATYKQNKKDFERTNRDRTAGAAVMQHMLKRLFWLTNADLLFDENEPGYPTELAGSRLVLNLSEPRSVAAVGRGARLTSDASGHTPELLQGLRHAWANYLVLLDDVDRAPFYGADLDAFQAPHKVGAQVMFRAWIYNAAVKMYGTVVALPEHGPRHAHAATGGGDAEAPRSRFDFVEIVSSSSLPYRLLAQLCAIFTVPTRLGPSGGPGREAFVLLRYLTPPQTQPPTGSPASFLTLAYNERRYFSNKNGNPATAAAAPRYTVESLETVSRVWPVRPRVVSRGGVANVEDGFFSPRVL